MYLFIGLPRFSSVLVQHRHRLSVSFLTLPRSFDIIIIILFPWLLAMYVTRAQTLETGSDPTHLSGEKS